MAPVGGRPFLDILLRQLERSGVTRVLLSVGYLHAAIEEHFGSTFAAMSLDYVVEATPLGSGGAIRKALTMAKEDSALVLNGDTFLDADYAAMMRFYCDRGVAVTIAVTRQANIARYGGVMIGDDQVIGFEEKGLSGPGWINAGATFSAGIFPGLPNLEKSSRSRRIFWRRRLRASSRQPFR